MINVNVNDISLLHLPIYASKLFKTPPIYTPTLYLNFLSMPLLSNNTSYLRPYSLIEPPIYASSPPQCPLLRPPCRI